MKKVLAILLTFVLTAALVLFCVSFLGRQIVLPAMNENGAPVSDDVIREEQQLARERITKLADLYGFEAEPVIRLIDEETLRDLNSQASGWWSTLLREGTTGEALQWDTGELEQVLASDPRLNGNEDRERAEYLEESAAEDVRNSILRMVLPMRIQVIRLAMQEIGKRVDLLSLITFFLGVPWAALALCALLTGLIVLLREREPRGAALYVGSAMGAAALVLAALVALYMCAGILPMIREASAGLAVQYQSVLSGTLVRAGILAAAMAAGCVLCLARKRKNGGTA